MRKVTHPEVGWEVLTQPTGEVLTAEARSPGLHLGLLGVPEGFAPRDAEGWLYDVVGVTHESSVSRPPSRPLPALLDHALSGLLFSHGELWDRPGSPSPCSYAFVEGRGEIGFGWIGEARVSVWVDGQHRSPVWVTLRDERGREARGWSIPSHHDVQVRISWCRSLADPGAGGAEVEASWGGQGGEAVGLAFPDQRERLAAVPVAAVPSAPGEREDHGEPPPSGADPASAAREPVVVGLDAAWPAAEPEAEPGPAPAETPRAAGGFTGWLRNAFAWLAGRRRGEGDTGASESVAWMEVPAAPPAPEQAADAATSGTAEPLVAEGTPRDAVAEPPPATGGADPEPTGEAGVESMAPQSGDPGPGHVVEPAFEPRSLAPPSAEPPAAAGLGSVTPPEAGPAPPEPVQLIPPGPEPTELIPPGQEPVQLIPPSPEPVELTSNAVAWVDTEDPHAIDLPALDPPPATDAAAAPAEPAREETGLRIVDVTPEEPETFTAPGPSVPLRLEGLQAWAESLPEPPADGAAEVIETFPPTAEVTPTADAIAMPAADAEPAREPATEPAMEPASDAPPIAVAAAPPAAKPQHPAWPTPQELARPRWLPGRRHGLWIALVGALFAGGWLVGALQDEGKSHDAGRRGALGQALSAVGLGGPRFVVQVSSRPPGAWITVDGEHLNLRTPAAVEVPPGERTIGLSFSEFGGATYTVRGSKGDRVPLDATLWGALEVFSPSEVGVIAVSVDGVARGLAPLRVDSLSPGVHEVRFSGLDIASWGQTVDIRVGETRELLARAVTSPSVGVLQVEASLTDETGTQPLKGAQVFIDGEPRGTTPLTLDLPRGPHSVRLVHKGHEAPIQVIDLPGGNQRFAVFELGLDQESPRISVEAPARIPRDRPAVLSATLLGVPASEVREMWLHVRMGEGAWRRYGMTLLKAPAGAAGVVTFPTAAFDGEGRARYYVSAQSGQGDETFTEVRTIQLETPKAR
jgi:hypothetical protein